MKFCEFRDFSAEDAPELKTIFRVCAHIWKLVRLLCNTLDTYTRLIGMRYSQSCKSLFSDCNYYRCVEKSIRYEPFDW